MDINKVMLIGNMVREPKMAALGEGKNVANFSLATNATWKDAKTGTVKKSVEFHDLAAFGRLAEVIGQYTTKGQKVYVEGKLRTRTWADKAGVKRRSTEIICDNLIMLSRGKGSSTPTDAAPEEVLSEE